ncbi:MAG TPA: hypothetical protein VFO91_11980 [Anaerolineales bacterium]|nr:hypothetical protein [Anaerolineales bacterium]
MSTHSYIERNIPLLFLIVTILAYGLLLPLTGFYWDDWPFAWIARFLGPEEFIPAFAGVRPFLGPFFLVTTSLIPPVPIYWQIFALLIRFLSGLSAWFALSQIWPHHKRQALIASLLFLVFPGYSQHWVAFTHINQEWIPFIFYLLSFGFTARALRNPDKVLRDTTSALLLLIAGVFPTEYFIGLEPLRFFFIWVILSERLQGLWQRLTQTLRHWWPYLLIWLANAAWLAYFYAFGAYGSYEVEVAQDPPNITEALSALGEALWKAGFYIWMQVLVLISETLSAPTTLATLVLMSVSFVALILYLKKFDHSYGETRIFAVPAIVIGLAGILLGRLPSLAAGLPLTLQSSYDRFMISMMLGGSLFIVGLVELLVRNVHAKNYGFALLIALGIGQQFFNANIFRRDWTKQQEIYWQLAWRIPALEPGTALLTDQMPIDYETDLSFTAPINWMYAPDYKRSDLPYALIYTEKRLGRGALPSLESDSEIYLDFRQVAFQGSTSQAITIHMPRNGCLRVLDPARGDQITYSRQSRFLVDAIPLSDPALIIPDSGAIAKLPFLSEPEHTWCYYYAKAELAYQKGDWDQVINLMEEAISLGYEPEDPFEWLTYIEAQALTGDIEAAQQRSTEAFMQDKRIRDGLCQLWKRVQDRSAARSGTATRISQALTEFQCAR